MAISPDDEGRGHVPGCSGCGARLAPDQRYCLACGERRGAIPAAVAKWLSIVEPAAEPDASPAPEATPAPAAAADEEASLRRYMPEPKSAAVAVLTVLAFGVLLGGLTGPAAQSAGIAPIVLYSEAEPPPQPVAEAPQPVAEASEPAPAPSAPAELLPEEPAPEEPAASPPKKTAPPKLPEEPGLPPVQHVFLIVLADHGFEETYGAGSTAPYFSQTLAEKGELLPNYYAVTKGDLANEIALISGQGPNPATAANCPEYKDFATPTLSATGQAEGEGCLYPAETQTLPGQLVAAKKTWKAYVEGIGSGQAGEPTTCRHPAPGELDPAQVPRPADPYETWRNPFVYFHAVVDGSECAERDIGLEQLSVDLKAEARTPSFSYIVPSACHDGGEVACEPGAPTGLAAAQPFLEATIAAIEASPAYKKSGLIAIVSAQARQDTPEPDASACCGTPAYPNLPPPEAPPPATGPVKESGGGGRVGMLLLSPFVEPGSVNESGYYNHFSFLLSVDELLGLTPPPGYAAEPALAAFDGTVFNHAE